MSWYGAADTMSIALLAGGDSAERSVSLNSGREVAAALTAAGHRVEWFDPAVAPLAEIPWPEFDACFLALHGGAGEDGRIQQQLDDLGVVYTGSGPQASKLAMSKSTAKERWVAARVPTLPWTVFQADQPFDQTLVDCQPLGWPLVVKPESQGSSLGVGVATDAGQLAQRITESRQFDSLTLVEPWIDGREFTVALLDREPLPLLEIVAPRQVFDFDAKYSAGGAEHRFDVDLPAEARIRLQSVAVAAAAALETRGLVRVDLMVDRVGRPWVLELNTLPGLTATSLAPRAAAQAGLDLAALCQWMVLDALQTQVRR
jgi:D-alanine-D-alanine ligase